MEIRFAVELRFGGMVNTNLYIIKVYSFRSIFRNGKKFFSEFKRAKNYKPPYKKRFIFGKIDRINFYFRGETYYRANKNKLDYLYTDIKNITYNYHYVMVGVYEQLKYKKVKSCMDFVDDTNYSTK